jgi:hypothetical protein
MPRTPNETVPRQFRLGPETLADLDAVRAWLAGREGRKVSRAEAIRHLAREAALKIRESPRTGG